MLTINNSELILKILNDKSKSVNPYVHKKLLCFRAIINGHKTLEVCEMFLVPRRTLNDWVLAWNSNGFESLERGFSTGRRSKLTKEYLEEIKNEFSKWETFTSEDVKKFIHDRYDIDFCIEWINIILKRKFNFHHSKPYVLPKEQPENAEEILKENLDKTINQVFEDLKINDLKEIAFGFLDESSPENKANTSRLWSIVSNPKVKKSAKKLNANTAGFYSLNGNSTAISLEKSKKEDIAEILKEIHYLNQDYKAIVVVLDNCKVHHSNYFIEEAKKSGIYLTFLPPYSPNLNPIEFIWKSIKRYISQKNFD